jgi:hypothetical protein
MTLEELSVLRDGMVTMSSLTADIAYFLSKALEKPDTITEEWVFEFAQKMTFMQTASIELLNAQIGESATGDIYDTIMRSQ